MDISTLTQNYDPNSAWMDVLHPVTGAKTGIQLQVASVDSPTYRKASHAIQNRRLSSGTRSAIKAEVMDEEGLNLICACVVGWKGMEKDGKPLLHTPAAVYDLLSDPKYGWLKDQVDKFIGDRANFFRD